MNKEIVDTFERLIKIPKPQPIFRLEDVWEVPMITLTKDLADIINANDYLINYGFVNTLSVSNQIGSKFCVNFHDNAIDETKLREVLKNGGKEDLDNLFFFFKDDEENSLASEIADCLGEFEPIPNDLLWHIGLCLRVYAENGGDLEKLIADTKKEFGV